jgi:hypothetical protein
MQILLTLLTGEHLVIVLYSLLGLTYACAAYLARFRHGDIWASYCVIAVIHVTLACAHWAVPPKP